MADKPDHTGDRMLAALSDGDGLTWRERCFKAYLAYCDGPGGAFPGFERMADDLGVDRRDAVKVIDSLEAKGSVRKERRPRMTGHSRPTATPVNYPLYPPDPPPQVGNPPTRLPSRQSADADSRNRVGNSPRTASADYTNRVGNPPMARPEDRTGRGTGRGEPPAFAWRWRRERFARRPFPMGVGRFLDPARRRHRRRPRDREAIAASVSADLPGERLRRALEFAPRQYRRDCGVVEATADAVTVRAPTRHMADYLATNHAVEIAAAFGVPVEAVEILAAGAPDRDRG